jgi:hypothetical protein
MLDALQMVDAKKAPIIAGVFRRDESRLLIHLTNTVRRGFSSSFLLAPSMPQAWEQKIIKFFSLFYCARLHMRKPFSACFFDKWNKSVFFMMDFNDFLSSSESELFSSSLFEGKSPFIESLTRLFSSFHPKSDSRQLIEDPIIFSV